MQLARSLMTDPELVLLDEPAAGLDLGGRETLVRDLSELAGDRRSPVLVLVTHHVEEIPPGFTHGLLLRRGRIVAAGPIDEVLTDDTLSSTFDMPLEVTAGGNRWSARAASRLTRARTSRRGSPRVRLVCSGISREAERWMGDSQWLIWLALALAAGIAEVLSLNLVFLMVAGGGGGRRGRAAFGAGGARPGASSSPCVTGLLLVRRAAPPLLRYVRQQRAPRPSTIRRRPRRGSEAEVLVPGDARPAGASSSPARSGRREVTAPGRPTRSRSAPRCRSSASTGRPRSWSPLVNRAEIAGAVPPGRAP